MADSGVRQGLRLLFAGGLEQLETVQLLKLELMARRARRLKRAPLYLPGPGDVVHFRGLTRRPVRHVVRLLLPDHVLAKGEKGLGYIDDRHTHVAFVGDNEPQEPYQTVLVSTWRAAAREKDPVVLQTGAREYHAMSGWIPCSVVDELRACNG